MPSGELPTNEEKILVGTDFAKTTKPSRDERRQCLESNRQRSKTHVYDNQFQPSFKSTMADFAHFVKQ
jgi:hypothetical protein